MERRFIHHIIPSIHSEYADMVCKDVPKPHQNQVQDQLHSNLLYIPVARDVDVSAVDLVAFLLLYRAMTFQVLGLENELHISHSHTQAERFSGHLHTSQDLGIPTRQQLMGKTWWQSEFLEHQISQDYLAALAFGFHSPHPYTGQTGILGFQLDTSLHTSSMYPSTTSRPPTYNQTINFQWYTASHQKSVQ